LGRKLFLQRTANWSYEENEPWLANPGSYTWGKSIDNNSGVIAGDTFGNGVGSLHWYDLSLSRALSDYNIAVSW